jgi:hypothetical protein
MSVKIVDEIIRLFTEISKGLSDGSLKVKDSQRIDGLTLDELKMEISSKNRILSYIQGLLIIIHLTILVFQHSELLGF